MPTVNGKDNRNRAMTCASPEKTSRQRGQSLPQSLVYVSSEHPLVQQVIIGTLQADMTDRLTILPAPNNPPLLNSDAAGVVIVDIDSVPYWKELLSNWGACGIRPIAIIARGAVEFSEQVRLLNQGVFGIVRVSPTFSRELLKAVKVVLEGNLWINPVILQEYVKQKNMLLARIPESHLLTAREQQIIDCLIRSLSNKQIGSLLGISERTVKFHVSNILQKARVESRRELLQLHAERQTVYMAGG